MKPVAIGFTGAAGTLLTTLQAVGEAHVAVQTVAAVLGSTIVGAMLWHLVRRVNAIPTEQSIKRQDAIDRINEVMGANYDRLDESMQRMEARLVGAIEANTGREATERHRLEDRVRELERESPRRPT